MSCRFVIVGILTISGASAAPPAGTDPNSPTSQWYQSLKAPDGSSCCSLADCRPTEWRTRSNHYEAFIAGSWRVVPPDKVLHRVDNPTGGAVVCWTPERGIMCFMRGTEG